MKKLVLLSVLLTSVFGFNSIGQNKITSVSFSSNSSADFDTLFSVIDLNVPHDSLDYYQIEMCVSETISGQLVMMNSVNVELEDYGAAALYQIKFNETTEHYEFIIDVLPIGQYSFQVKLKLLDGTLIEESQILSE